jgi:hypothetical protein
MSQASIMLSGCPTLSISCSLRRLNKLGARGISVVEAEQTIWNRHVVVREPAWEPGEASARCARAPNGQSDASRVLTLVIEETIEPTTWMLVTGWDSTAVERKILERS